MARDAFWRLLIELSRRDRVTVFISTHFMNEAERCDRMSMMHAGKVLDSDVPAKLVEKLKKNKRFDLDDFRDQMAQMQNMGSMESLLDKLPGGAQMQAQLKSADAEKQVRRTMAILNSMTPQERRFPDLLKASRKRRIAKGSGVEVQQVNQLLRQFESTRDMMKKFAGGGMAKLMRGLGGRMPKGMLPPPR